MEPVVINKKFNSSSKTSENKRVLNSLQKMDEKVSVKRENSVKIL
jgi:hypothetical protein